MGALVPDVQVKKVGRMGAGKVMGMKKGTQKDAVCEKVPFLS